jgi:hypothetical protein
MDSSSFRDMVKWLTQRLHVYGFLKICFPHGFRVPIAGYSPVAIPVPPLKVEHVGYWGRDEKARHVARRYGKYFLNSVLDVGCDQKQLRDAIGRPDLRYVGVDRSAPADLCVDLEKQTIPVSDDEFDTVLCLDALEHLDGIHAAVADLVRCTRRFLIISLPNNWFGVYDYMLRGYGIPRFYGLPISYPDDRHRWFFNFDDADCFLQCCAERHRLRIVERIAEWRVPGWPWWKRPFHALRLLGPRNSFFRNRFYQTIWYVFEKAGREE